MIDKRSRFVNLSLYLSIILFLNMFLTACGVMPLPQDYHPVEFTEKPSPHGENKFPNWPEPPQVIENRVSKDITSGQRSGKAIAQQASNSKYASETHYYLVNLYQG